MIILKTRVRVFLLIALACIIYACASISREVATPAETDSKPPTPDLPASVVAPESARQKNKRQRSEKDAVPKSVLEQKKIGHQDNYGNSSEERTAPAAAPLMKESVVPKREMLEEGGIGGTGNTDCADNTIKPGCSKTY